MIRFGKVVAVDEVRAMARVQIEDADAVITYWLPVLHQKTQDDKHYWLPDIGELVVCAFYEDSWDTGVILGAVYNEKDKPPANTKDKAVIKFKDGTQISYDRATGTLSLNVKNTITIQTQQTNLQSPTITIQFQNINAQGSQVSITGNISVQGNVLVQGSLTATQGLKTATNGRTLFVDNLVNTYNSHTHTDSRGRTTSPPNQTY